MLGSNGEERGTASSVTASVQGPHTEVRVMGVKLSGHLCIPSMPSFRVCVLLLFTCDPDVPLRDGHDLVKVLLRQSKRMRPHLLRQTKSTTAA